jgi:hypothetical protein
MTTARGPSLFPFILLLIKDTWRGGIALTLGFFPFFFLVSVHDDCEKMPGVEWKTRLTHVLHVKATDKETWRHDRRVRKPLQGNGKVGCLKKKMSGTFQR